MSPLFLAFLGFAAAFAPPTVMAPMRAVAVVSPSAEVTMFLGGKKSTPKAKAAAPAKKAAAPAKKFGLFGNAPASPTKPKVTAKAKPLSPGSNYPATKNIQTQASGFGNFVSKFQTVGGKSKYGVPLFLKNGNVNPAYLAAERKAIAEQSKLNVRAEAAKTKKLKAKGVFELGDVIRKTVGNVGSGKEYYQSGR